MSRSLNFIQQNTSMCRKLRKHEKNEQPINKCSD